MRNPVVFFLLLGVTLAGPAAAQPAVSPAHPDVPAAFDVAGLHLVLTEEARRLVQQKADGLHRHQPSFQARVDVADASFPIIDRVLKEEGVPLDFRYLALQESALQGDAESPHGAVGYWQLKRETATSLGLAVNDAVDERKHLTASTRAAARYLSRNNASLNNWLNALLSYYTGLGGVRPYTLPTDAGAGEMTITESTSPYVLMFLAHKVAFEPFCGLNPRPALRLQEFPAVAGQSLSAQAQTIYADPAALAVHNRWLLAAAVPADRAYTLIVPVTDAAQAAGIVANQRVQIQKDVQALGASNQAEVRLNNLRALIALPGETTADLARRGGQKLGEFLHHNEMTGFDAAVAGLPYYLESKRDAGAVEYHVLQPGETIFEVAQKYGMRQKAVLTKNRLAANDELRPGRVLWLQHVRPREVAAEYRTVPENSTAGRATADARATDPTATASRAATPAPAPARPNHDSEEGWGDALPAPRPIVIASETVQLPPPAPAPAPAPLADEPRQPAPDVVPVISRVPAEPRPAPAPVAVARPVPIATPAARPAAPAPRLAPALPKAVISKAVTFAAAPALATTHQVQAGETVYSLSRRYQLAPATLMAINGLTPPANLAVGQKLQLQTQEPQQPVNKPIVMKPTVVTRPAAPDAVKPAVAVRPAAPAAGSRHSGLANPAALYVPKPAAGQAAKPAAAKATVAVVAPAATSAGTPALHTVAAGETLYSISRRYAVTVVDILAWNAKADATVKIGEVLRLQAPAK